MFLWFVVKSTCFAGVYVTSVYYDHLYECVGVCAARLLSGLFLFVVLTNIIYVYILPHVIFIYIHRHTDTHTHKVHL